MSESEAVGDPHVCEHCQKVFLEKASKQSHEWSCPENPDGGTPGGGSPRPTALEQFAAALRERLEEVDADEDLPDTARELDPGVGVYSTAARLRMVAHQGPINGVHVTNQGRKAGGCVRWEVTLDDE